jgi:hypothetical protein
VAHLLTTQLRLAGYSAVREAPNYIADVQVSGAVATNRNYGGPPVVGCENGFINNAAATYSTLACVPGAPNTAPDSLSIVYEGDASNTVPTAGAVANSGTDCLGQQVTPTTSSAAQTTSTQFYAQVENRFFLALDPNTGNSALYCAGVGSNAFATPPQPLIDNVIDMQITYGVANIPGASARESTTDPYFDTVRYMNATQVNALQRFPNAATPPPDAQWRRVNSAIVCLLLRSDQGAVDRATPYTDCQGAQVAPAANDLRAYRVVRIQVAFKNRTAPCPDGNGGARPDHCDFLIH